MQFSNLKMMYVLLALLLISGLIFSMMMPEPKDDLTTGNPMTMPSDTTDFLHPEMSGLPSKIEDQIAILEKKIAEKPTDWPHVRMLAGLYSTVNPMKSVALYQNLKTNRQLSADDWVELGQLYMGSGKLDSTKICNEEALKLDAENLKALYNLGAISANSGHYDAAMNFWKKVNLNKADSEVKILVTNGINQLSKMK